MTNVDICIEFFTDCINGGLFFVDIDKSARKPNSFNHNSMKYNAITVYHTRGNAGKVKIFEVLCDEEFNKAILSFGNRKQPSCMDFINKYTDMLFDMPYIDQYKVLEAIFETDVVQSAIIINDLR